MLPEKGDPFMQRIEENAFSYFTASHPFTPSKPSLVFIHGAAINAAFWKLQLDGLSGSVNCFAPNLPGRSAAEPEACVSVSDQADYILNFMEHVGIQAPVLCGLSMGGGIVLELLARKPSLFPRGIVINSGARLRVSPLISDTIRENFSVFRELQMQMGLSPHSDPQAIRPVLEAAAIESPETALKDFLACDRFDIMDQLHRITAPVLILTASEDRLSPVKFGAYLKDHITNASLKCIEGAGHLSPVEKPEEVNHAILEFISRQP